MTDSAASANYDDAISSISSQFWSRPSVNEEEPFHDEDKGPPSSFHAEKAPPSHKPKPLPTELMIPAIAVLVAQEGVHKIDATKNPRRGPPPVRLLNTRVFPRWVRESPLYLKAFFIFCVILIVLAVALIVSSSLDNNSNQNTDDAPSINDANEFLAELKNNGGSSSSSDSDSNGQNVMISPSPTSFPTSMTMAVEEEIQTTVAAPSDEFLVNDQDDETSTSPTTPPETMEIKYLPNGALPTTPTIKPTAWPSTSPNTLPVATTSSTSSASASTTTTTSATTTIKTVMATLRPTSTPPPPPMNSNSGNQPSSPNPLLLDQESNVGPSGNRNNESNNKNSEDNSNIDDKKTNKKSRGKSDLMEMNKKCSKSKKSSTKSPKKKSSIVNKKEKKGSEKGCR